MGWKRGGRSKLRHCIALVALGLTVAGLAESGPGSAPPAPAGDALRARLVAAEAGAVVTVAPAFTRAPLCWIGHVIEIT